MAALRASQLGMSVALVESTHFGGVCLNWGCIPTKALLRSSEIHHLLHELGTFGLSADNISFDLSKIVGRSRSIARRMGGGIAHLLKKTKVTTFDGRAKLAGRSGEAHQVAITKDGAAVATIKAPHVILATGARGRQLPGLETDGTLIWGAREAMTPKNSQAAPRHRFGRYWHRVRILLPKHGQRGHDCRSGGPDPDCRRSGNQRRCPQGF